MRAVESVMKEPSRDQSRPVYDELADRYDNAMALCERLGLARLRAAALRELPVGGRILEVGAGTGLNFRHYPKGARGVAVELSYEMLRQARGKSERPIDLRLVQAR